MLTMLEIQSRMQIRATANVSIFPGVLVSTLTSQWVGIKPRIFKRLNNEFTSARGAFKRASHSPPRICRLYGTVVSNRTQLQDVDRDWLLDLSLSIPQPRTE